MAVFKNGGALNPYCTLGKCMCVCCIIAHTMAPDVYKKKIYPDCFSLCLIDFFQEALSKNRKSISFADRENHALFSL